MTGCDEALAAIIRTRAHRSVAARPTIVSACSSLAQERGRPHTSIKAHPAARCKSLRLPERTRSGATIPSAARVADLEHVRFGRGHCARYNLMWLRKQSTSIQCKAVVDVLLRGGDFMNVKSSVQHGKKASIRELSLSSDEVVLQGASRES